MRADDSELLDSILSATATLAIGIAPLQNLTKVPVSVPVNCKSKIYHCAKVCGERSAKAEHSVASKDKARRKRTPISVNIGKWQLELQRRKVREMKGHGVRVHGVELRTSAVPGAE